MRIVSREMTLGCSTEDHIETSELLFLQISCKNLILLRFEAISLVWLSSVSKNSPFNWTHVESNPTYLRGSYGRDLCAFLLLFELHIIYSFRRTAAAEKECPLLLKVSHIFLRVSNKEQEVGTELQQAK